MSRDHAEYVMPTCLAETTPGRSDCAARILTPARLCLNSSPEAPQNWGQINPNPNDYHSDPIEIISTLWIPDITVWWRQEDETQSKYLNLSKMAYDPFYTI